jgi:hypothetical protein
VLVNGGLDGTRTSRSLPDSLYDTNTAKILEPTPPIHTCALHKALRNRFLRKVRKRQAPPDRQIAKRVRSGSSPKAMDISRLASTAEKSRCARRPVSIRREHLV